MSIETLYDYSTLAIDLPYGMILLKKILIFMSNFIEPNNPPSLEIHARY